VGTAIDGFVPPIIVALSALALLGWRRFYRKSGRADVAIVLALFLLAALLEVAMGRPLAYRHGPIRVWSGDIKSDQNSQQIADPYTLTHVIHGALFYGLTRLVLPWGSLGTRAIAAIAAEAAWEVYENTDTVVGRYRTETISLGYYGDSVINSMTDILACVVGFVLAWRLPRSVTIAWVIVVEVVLAFWIRDNLTLNILMLVHPIRAIRTWQAGL
jgi:Protein of unknown function (DUF2585)